VVITLIDTDEFEALRARLEEQYEECTERLAAQLASSRQRRPNPTSAAALASAVATSQLALAETATALRRMAEGSYGRCERCGGTIAMQVLRLSPAARFCQQCVHPGA
jgi:RNA polymerase-binding transcription factor DksA